jgi:hypothetical protein
VKNGFADYELLLRTLGYALIEIRACDNLREAQTLADVFHNVPAGVASGLPADEIRRGLDFTAKRLGFQRYVDSLFDDALQNMKH